MTGRSQAVRLPKAYRFEADEVAIHREGERVILEPIKPTWWPRGFFQNIRISDRAFRRPDQDELPPAPELS